MKPGRRAHLEMPRTADGSRTGPRPQHVGRPRRTGKVRGLRAGQPAANRDGSRSDESCAMRARMRGPSHRVATSWLRHRTEFDPHRGAEGLLRLEQNQFAVLDAAEGIRQRRPRVQTVKRLAGVFGPDGENPLLGGFLEMDTRFSFPTRSIRVNL